MLLELADHDGDVDRAIEVLTRGERPAFGGIVWRLQSAGRLDAAVEWIDRAVAASTLSAATSTPQPTPRRYGAGRTWRELANALTEPTAGCGTPIRSAGSSSTRLIHRHVPIHRYDLR